MNMDTTAKKIITIDDQRAVRRSLKAFLEDSGFNVLEAENGREGISLIQAESPDLVLCDLRMPEVDGLEVVKYVLEEESARPSDHHRFRYRCHR